MTLIVDSVGTYTVVDAWRVRRGSDDGELWLRIDALTGGVWSTIEGFTGVRAFAAGEVIVRGVAGGGPVIIDPGTVDAEEVAVLRRASCEAVRLVATGEHVEHVARHGLAIVIDGFAGKLVVPCDYLNGRVELTDDELADVNAGRRYLV